MNFQEIKLAIETYFTGEAAEAYIVIGGYIFIVLCAGLLWFKFSDRFSITLSITTLVLALFMSSGFGYLLIRDSVNRQNLVQLVESQDTEEVSQTLQKEKDRMQTVADGYLNLRRMFAVSALVGAILIIFTHNSVSHAIAVGMMFFAMSGAIIDHYSEERASIYLEKLNSQLQISEK
jgi:hypothetical protein